MNAENLAEWLRRRGHRIIEGAGSLWYDAGARVFQPVPFHRVFAPPEAELRHLMRKAGALGLRYSAPPGFHTGLLSYHVIFDQGPYTIDRLSPRTRNKIRRGLRESNVVPISLDQLAAEGWRLQQDTLSRQGRAASMDRAGWERLCRAARGLPGFEAWGAFVGEELAATLLLTRVDDTFLILTSQSRSDYLNKHVNNALCFSVSAELWERPGVRAIFYSTHSLDAPSSVDEFKFLMGYRARPVRQRVCFHPLAAPLFNPLSHAAVRLMLRAGMDHPALRKAEGLLRFYLEGRQPTRLQQPPAMLSREVFDGQAPV